MIHENFDILTSWNLLFQPLEPKTSLLFWLDTSMDIALTDQLYDKLIQPVYFSEQYCMKVFSSPDPKVSYCHHLVSVVRP
jgi:hypothetical protein